MPDGLELNLTIEELHVHIHADGVDAEPDGIGLEDVEDEGSGHTAHHNRASGLSYDTRDKPIKGLILEIIADSDGVTRDGLLSTTAAKPKTVDGSLSTLAETGLVDTETHSHNGSEDEYYTLTELGERVLETYQQRWVEGYKILPQGYWEDVVG